MAPSRPCISGRPGRSANPPERQCHAFGRKRLLHEIVVADGGAADGDEDVGAAFAGAPDGGDGVVEPVGDDAEIGHVGAFGARERSRAHSRWRRRSARAPVRARRHQFVAGREQRDFRAPVHRDERMIHAGGKRKVARREAVAGREQHVACREVEPSHADVAALWRRLLPRPTGRPRVWYVPGSRRYRRRPARRRR